MKIWTNTKTLDGHIPDLEITTNKKVAEVALLGSKPINLSQFPNLKGIFRVGVGKENIDFEIANKRNIIVGFPSENTIEIIYEETANFTCSSIFRMMYSNIGMISNGVWVKFDRKSLW